MPKAAKPDATPSFEEQARVASSQVERRVRQLEAAPEPAPQQGISPADQELNAYLQGLLDGSVKPDSEAVAYFAKELAEAHGLHQALARNLQQGEQQLLAGKAELVKLEGRLEQTVRSIKKFRVKAS